MRTSLLLILIASVSPASASCDATGTCDADTDMLLQIGMKSSLHNQRINDDSEGPVPEMDPNILNACYEQQNMYRAKEGLPALKRWTELEVCTQKMARADMRSGKAHNAIRNGMFAADCAPLYKVTKGQNGCPSGWSGNPKKLLDDCMWMMWKEKKNPGCSEGKKGACGGHYITLRGGDPANAGGKMGGYNGYDHVACGYYVQDNQAWFYMNFGNVNKGQFMCGGNKYTHPSKKYIEDCAEPGNYNGCPADYSALANCTPTPNFVAKPTPPPAPRPPPAPSPPGGGGSRGGKGGRTGKGGGGDDSGDGGGGTPGKTRPGHHHHHDNQPPKTRTHTKGRQQPASDVEWSPFPKYKGRASFKLFGFTAPLVACKLKCQLVSGCSMITFDTANHMCTGFSKRRQDEGTATMTSYVPRNGRR